MDFIVRDLLIRVVPLGRLLDGVPRLLNAGGDVGGCGSCTGMTTCPTGCTGVTPHPHIDGLEEIISPVNIAVLKAQLQESLAAVEAREVSVHEALRPKTSSEIAILQTHLETALESVKHAAEEIRKREEAE